MLMDIERLQRKKVGWQEQTKEYKMLGCKIGELYASLIGKLSGELRKENTASLINYAGNIDLLWARILLSRGHNEVVSLPFPGSLYSWVLLGTVVKILHQCAQIWIGEDRVVTKYFYLDFKWP